jgi:alkanesulfonate monooxygenase SsuD/methylene tetrahydromethanopterin reductase-like flavin-dependent oxidoreductase (luciferase family)
MVTGVTYRHPSVLAAEAVTVDHVSGGRLELGLGAGWFEDEHRQLGIAFPPTRERAERLEEATQVIRLLMTTDGADFAGRHYRLEGASYHPRPVQEPHPPIWIGASGERLTLPIVGRQADVWNAFPPAGDIARKWGIVAEHAERAGRDPATIAVSSFLSISEPWAQVQAQAEALRAAGVSILVVSWPGDGRPRVDEFIERVMPDLTQM